LFGNQVGFAGKLLVEYRQVFLNLGLRGRFIERVFADGGYAGERVATATRIVVEIVAKRARIRSALLFCRADG
jgi:hypothetical protein